MRPAFLIIFLACLSTWTAAAMHVAAAPQPEEDLPRWTNSGSTAVVFTMAEDYAYTDGETPVTFSNKSRSYTLWGKDINGAPPTSYMAEQRYKSIQSVVMLFCCHILDNPEEFKWTGTKSQGTLNFCNQIQARGSWEYRRPDGDNVDIIEMQGEFTLINHPWTMTGNPQTLKWKLVFDDVNDLITDMEYQISATVVDTGVVELATGKVHRLDKIALDIKGKGCEAHFKSNEALPPEIVQGGIEMASAWLTASLPRYRDLTFTEIEQDLFRKPDPIGPGRLALMLLALAAKNDVSQRKDIQDALAWYVIKPDRMMKAETYTVSLFLMAYHEIMRTARDAFAEQTRKDLDELAGKLARRLLSDQKPKEGWGYPLNPANISTTQFALLGLYAAVEDGLIEKDSRDLSNVLSNAANVLFRAQQKQSVEVMLRHPAFGRKNEKVQARGWSYSITYSSGPYGSMTAAGIGSQALIYRLLLQGERLSPQAKDALLASIDSGLAWMQEHYNVEKCFLEQDAPLGFELDEKYHYYYLYSLEKAGTLCGVKSMKLNEWYRDLALHLLSDQHPDGRFFNGHEWSGPDVATAFGLLVLKNASAGIVTDVPIPGEGIVSEDKE